MSRATPQLPRNSKSLAVIRPIRVPRSLMMAAMLIAGIWSAEQWPPAATATMLVTGLLLLTSWLLARCRLAVAEAAVLWLAVVGLGASLWTVRNASGDGRDIGVLAAEGIVSDGSPVRLTGTVASIPALDSVADSLPASETDQPPRTLFLLSARSLWRDHEVLPVRGICRLIVDGDATRELAWGDVIEVMGQMDQPKTPQNPGEFDYAQHLRRKRISVMMFVKHPAAAVVRERSRWRPGYWLSVFRRQAANSFACHLSPRNRAAAEAMLLGNRGHLTPDLEQDFIASGTMHLLAISGLHVGILYVFLLRTLNALLVSRTRALLLAGMVCVFYCLLTDLRPSVMRATGFIVFHIAGQLLYREVRMGSLIGSTIVLLLALDPGVAFDVGAWLSFVAVGALGWVAERTPPPPDRPVPIDAVGWREQFHEIRITALHRLGLRYRQLLAVTVLSAPLIATQFHVISVTGMLVNVVMIPFTALTLMVGYIFLLAATLFPPAAVLAGMPFELCLSGLNSAVTVCADVRFGFIAIPDLPVWFLPVYYLLLTGSAVAANSEIRHWLRLTLLVLTGLVLAICCRRPHSEGLTCTVLSVGHGNAVVVETPDRRVLLFDAGALNRGQRTVDVICRFLWSRGHRMIDSIVISHPDMDHYNAVGGLIDRMPVGQMIVTREFAMSQNREVRGVLDAAETLGIPCVIALHGDRVRTADLSVDFLQAATPHAVETTDNEASLVAVLSFRDQRICLPGDLEGTGQSLLLDELPPCDLLVSPHHGSPASNTATLGRVVQPGTVIVSSRDDRARDHIGRVFGSSRVYFTSEAGAVAWSLPRSGEPEIRSFVHDRLSR